MCELWGSTGVIATALAAAATASEPVYVGTSEANYELGIQHVDALVDDPYTLAGIMDVHGHEECVHAFGHDGRYEYIRLIPEADNKDEANVAGDYIQSTTILNGKYMYVNGEKERFMGWTGEKWSVTATQYMSDILSGKIASPFEGLVAGTGEGDRPEVMPGYEMFVEEDMDLEPEWRCLLRPLLREATTDVQEAELSIASKAVLEEKRELIKVHERLVSEAEEREKEAKCLKDIEKAMAALEACELQVLRHYYKSATGEGHYPDNWVNWLTEKRACVDEFSANSKVQECQPIFDAQWERYYGK